MEATATIAAPPIARPRLSERQTVWVWFACTLTACAAIFALLHQPYWMRAGDGDVCIGLARSLLRGQGFRFNGQLVSIVPPLWIWVLAGAMKITTSFAALKLLTIGLLLIGLAAFYFVLLRFTSPAVSAVILIATALVPEVYERVFWFHQEPMFFALLGLAILLAMQINEGRAHWWRIGALAYVCAGLVGVRWAGLLVWPIIAGALVSGDLLPRWNRRWIAVAVTGVVTAVAFFAIRAAMKVPPELVNLRFDASMTIAYDALNVASWEDYLRRISDSGRWIVGLCWNLLLQTHGLRALVDVIGWLVVILLAMAGWRALRTRQWVLVGVLLYFLVLVVNWPSPVPRYLMPVAPLLLAAVIRGVEEFKALFKPHIESQLGRRMGPIILGSIILCGLPMYAIELRHARSPNYPAKVFGGVDRQLVSGAEYLRRAGVMDGDVAVTVANTNMGRMGTTHGWMRSLNVLTGGIAIRTTPKIYSGPPDKTVMRWLRAKKVRYYLYATPQRLRLQHFHFYEEGETRPPNDWQLWDVTKVKPRLIPLPKECDWPTRVPGL